MLRLTKFIHVLGLDEFCCVGLDEFCMCSKMIYTLMKPSHLLIMQSQTSSICRSHPLFPLLRDLIIADMNFHSPSFPFALIANLPTDFDRLLQNYLARNPPAAGRAGEAGTAVRGVVLDALRYAHSALIEKIRSRKRQEGYEVEEEPGPRKPLSAIEDFCERFDRAVKNTMAPPPPVSDHPHMITLPLLSDDFSCSFSTE